MDDIGISRRRLMAGMTASAALSAGFASAPRAADQPRRTLLLTHPSFRLHSPGPAHVEIASRLTAIDTALAGERFSALRREAVPERDDVREAILRVHSPEHIERLHALSRSGRPWIELDPDTGMSPGSWLAATTAVAAGLSAVDAVMTPQSGVANAFCQVRPPGHHAERERAMGFCLFANVAIAGLYARAKHGAERIAVVDFDVHHGNGTQRIFWNDKNLFYASTHEMPLFPGTGAVGETGAHDNVCNAPLKAGDGGAEFRAAMRERILPRLDAFKPDIVLVSAGFDAAEGDLLGHLRLSEDDFAWATLQLADIAHRRCQGRLVSMLEGGYNLDALGRSAAAHVAALMTAAA